jgi:putative transposase
MRTRTTKFFLNSDHPDWLIATHQADQARRLYNTMVALAREVDRGVPGKVSIDLGLEAWVSSNPYITNLYGFEEVRATVCKQMEINLNAALAQKVLQRVSKSWNSYFALRKAGYKDARPPKCSKSKLVTVEYTNQRFSKPELEKGWLVPTGWKTGFKLPDQIVGKKLVSARLKCLNQQYRLDLVWEDKIEVTQAAVNKDYVAALDPGVNILATIVTNIPGERPKAVRGGKIKSHNQWANKETSHLKSLLPKGQYSSRRIGRVWDKRNRRVEYELQASASLIRDYLVEVGVSKLVFSMNEGWKEGGGMGKVNNQKFMCVPHSRFFGILKYKLELVGIMVVINEEAYTSKASFLDYDPVPAYCKIGPRYKFSGRRVKRGLYKSRDGRFIHADVNGAFNQLAKSKLFIGERSGIVGMPEELSVVSSSKQRL